MAEGKFFIDLPGEQSYRRIYEAGGLFVFCCISGGFTARAQWRDGALAILCVSLRLSAFAVKHLVPNYLHAPPIHPIIKPQYIRSRCHRLNHREFYRINRILLNRQVFIRRYQPATAIKQHQLRLSC